MEDKHEQWEKMEGILRPLAALISRPARLRYFGESLEANELEIALHTLCDFLLEPETLPVNGVTLEQVETLHKMMGIKDDCVERLKQKANHP